MMNKEERGYRTRKNNDFVSKKNDPSHSRI